MAVPGAGVCVRAGSAGFRRAGAGARKGPLAAVGSAGRSSIERTLAAPPERSGRHGAGASARARWCVMGKKELMALGIVALLVLIIGAVVTLVF
jgi:hypothetical protein